MLRLLLSHDTDGTNADTYSKPEQGMERPEPLNQKRTLLFLLGASVIVAALMIVVLPRVNVRVLQLIQVLADLCSWLTSGFLCLMLGKLAWKLRRNVAFATATCGLAVLAFAYGIRRFFDLLQVQTAPSTGSIQMAVWSSAISMFAATMMVLLLPFLRKITDLKIAAETAEARFIAAAEINAQPFLILKDLRSPMRSTSDFEIAFANTNAETLLHLKQEELVGRKLTTLFPSMRENGMIDRLKEALQNRQTYTGEVKDTTPEGIPLNFSLKSIVVEGGVAITIQNLEEERARKKHLEELNRFSQSIIQDAPFSIVATNNVGTITAVNMATEQLTGYRRHELVGKHSIVLLHDPAELSTRAMQLSSSLGEPVIAGFDTLIASLRRRKNNESEWNYVRSDGRKVCVHLAMTVLHDTDGGVTGYLAVAFDISERKKLNDSISFLAHHDGLTKLPNRMLLNERMREAIERAKTLDQQVAIFMVDLDYFKRINDSLGHWAGDQLLVEVSERLLTAVRKTDTVARVGGDEFILLMPNSGSVEDAYTCASRILSKLQPPIMLAGREVNITASVGFCIYPDWGGDPVSLLRNADAAMYAAKNHGRNHFQAFCGTMLEANSDRLELEADLRHALKNKQMFVAFQPQVDCKSGEIVGIEALLRWRHPSRGMVSPADFIPIAEESGLILQIGQWALKQACVETRRLQDKTGRRLTLAVNLSPRQFQQKDLSQVVERSVREAGMSPADLELEITESTLMVSSSDTLEELSRLRELGVRIAIDDFGTGFSNFKYILDYKADRLKIDRSFIAKCPHDTTASSVVRSVIAMAHGLNMKVVAEGVEAEEQMQFLLRKRCDEAQGFLLGKPMQLDQLIETIQNWTPRTRRVKVSSSFPAVLTAEALAAPSTVSKPM